MTTLLIYTNDNGSSVTEVSMTQIDLEEWLAAKVKELDDDPLTVTCLYVWNSDKDWFAEPVWHPAHHEEISI